MRIRTRLTLQFIIVTAGIFILALAFIYFQFRRHIRDEFYTLLESKGRMTAEMVLRHEEELSPIPEQPKAEPSRNLLPYGDNVVIYNEQLQRVFAINPLEPPLPKKHLENIRKMGAYRFANGKFDVFGAAVQSRSGKAYVMISEGIFDNAGLIQLRSILIITFLLIIGSVAAAGWFYAGQALDPVSRIVKEVDGILPTDLSRRVAIDDQKDELTHLVTTFNHLLDRIEYAFRMQRGFISNVSHELKNPLASMDAQLQLSLRKELGALEYQSILQSLHDDVRELTDTAEKLLQLAKVHSEAGSVVFSPLRLDEVMLQARDSLLKMHPQYSIVFKIQSMPEQEDELLVAGNELLLKTALMNLFDNGCKFSLDHKVWVEIRFGHLGYHEVEITDKGPGIPEAELQRIFEPFFRGAGNSQVKGSGIGLSLVQSILQLHQVHMEVRSVVHSGSVFTLRFPATKPVLTDA